MPKTLKIGGFIWEVKEDKNVSTEGNAFGSTHPISQKIFLEPGGTTQKQEETLIHEIMHAVWWQSGLSTRFKDNPKIEEEVISALSMGIYQVLKDNDLLK